MMKKFLIIILILIPASIFFAEKADAAVIAKTYSRAYTINDDYVQIDEYKEIKVTEQNWYIPSGSSEIFTIFYPIENDPNKDDKVRNTLDSIRVTDSIGNDLAYTSSLSDSGNLIIDVPIYTRINFGQSYRVHLSYKSYGLVVKSGNLRDAYIPSFPKDYSFDTLNVSENIFTQVKIPKSFGEINFTAPENDIQDGGEFWILDVAKEKLLGDTMWVQIGTEQYYMFEISQPFKKTSNFPIYNNTYVLPIPRDVDAGPINQKVYYTEISPSPYSIELDADGNLIATFKPKATEEGEILIKGFAMLTQKNDIDFKNSGSLIDIKADIASTYTKSAKFWEADSVDIQTAALEIKGEETNIYNLISKTYDFVIDKIDYSSVKRFGINERQGALKTLNGGAAVCMEYSDLFIALMRAQGVPARAAYGYGYSALDYETSSDETINHQWAEVYIPSLKTWINVDTTWGENGDALIGGDLNHFYSHVTSIDPQTPSTAEVKYYGSMGEIPERQMSVTATTKVVSEGAFTQDDLLKEYPEGSSNLGIGGVVEDVSEIVNNDFMGTRFGFAVLCACLVASFVAALFFGKKLFRKFKKKKKN